ncbi:hypothetical protein B0H13DRAFT_1899118 [Mycena leptocephala]|nr:hypothetical protein B0H13DRAFT_1899118 [Mycena leptocephala]
MLFQSISFALLALSIVYASPSPLSADAIVRSTCNVTIINLFVAMKSPEECRPSSQSKLQVSPPSTPSSPFPHTPTADINTQWDRDELSADNYIFTNHGTGQEISVNETNDHLITSSEAPATVFAVESAGGGEFVTHPVQIKLPNADSVWEAIFDGTSPIYGRIALRPASGSVYQRWTFT